MNDFLRKPEQLAPVVQPVTPPLVVPANGVVPIHNGGVTPLIPAGGILNSKMQFITTADGLRLIQSFEGISLEAYLDSVRVPTIGWGRIKYDDGRFVKMGDTCTREKADEWLLEDVEKDGAQYVRANFHDLTAAQFSALTSFCYNRGAGRLHALHVTTGGDIAKIPEAMLAYNWAGTPSNYLLGLDRRRWAEKNMFEGKDWREFEDLRKFEAFKARGYKWS